MDLSIIVVNWNTRDMTRNCLLSVFQALQGPDAERINAEVILIDNASSDGSVEMVEQDFPQVKLIKNSDNLGFAKANNQGFEIAEGRHLLLLNSDTLIHGDAMSLSVKYLDDHPQVGALGIKALNGDGSTQMTCHQFPSLLNMALMASGLWKLKWPKFFGRYHMTDWKRDSEREVEVISGCYLMLRREVLMQVGPLDESFFFFGEETDWCRSMRRAGWILIFSPLGTFTHFGSVSANKLNHRRDLLLAGAKVRLHRKDSLLAGCLAWLITVFFNVSRAAFWTFAALLSRSSRVQSRAKHFQRIVNDLPLIWKGGR